MDPNKPYRVKANKGKQGELDLTEPQYRAYVNKGLIPSIYKLVSAPEELSDTGKEIDNENKLIIDDREEKNVKKLGMEGRDIWHMRKPELKQWLRVNGLSQEGNKNELLKRAEEYLAKNIQ